MVTLARSLVVKEAREWLGTPYHSNQSVKGVGCDCVGFFLGVAKRIGFLSPHYFPPNYGKFARGQELLDYLDLILDRQPLAWGKKEGNIIATKQMGLISHLVIIIDDKTVVHCSQRLGVTLSPLARFSLYAHYSFPGIVDG